MHRQASRQGNEPGTQRPAGAEWAGRRRGEPAMPALSYAHGVSDVPLLGETIGANLARTASRFPDREALVDMASGRRWTYQQLSAEVDALARALLALGVEKGERVGIWAPNVPEWVFVQYATARIGAILVNINPAYRTSELAYVLRQAGIRTLVAAERFKTSDYRAMVEQVRPECPALREVFFVGTPDWDALLATSSTVDSAAVAGREATLSFDDPSNIHYTSGTTGFPKGATLSHHNILNNAYIVGEMLGCSEQDRVCIPVPFYHCFGMVMGNLACSSHGACMVVPAEAFDPGATLETIAAERCTSLYGVPTMFIAQLSHPRFHEFDLSSLRTGIMAGSPCPVEVMKQVQSLMHMPEVTICYGMTETSPVSTQSSRDDPLDRRVSTVGRVHPHVEIKVVSPETGGIVPRGDAGELCTRGYNVMLGYWGDEESTRQAIDPAGWMHTGDLAAVDELGYVNIVGRIKDMIIRGGENVYPREIEEALYSHPAILDVQVIGVPSHKYGEEVMAWVKLRPGAAATDEELVEFCRARIRTYKVPRD